MRSLGWLAGSTALALAAFACGDRFDGNAASGAGSASAAPGGGSLSGGAPGVGGAGGAAGTGGAGGFEAYCASVDVTAADCPPGCGKQECFCIPDSKPCEGLDEQACDVLGPRTDHDANFCDSVHGGAYDPETGFAGGPPSYLGCLTVHGQLGETEEETCTHPKGSDVCHFADTTAIPDDWVECGSTQCECATVLTAEDCPAGSGSALCCCHYPDSMPCLGLDQGGCQIRPGECWSVMGRAWDPASQMPSGPEIYLGCASQCPPPEDPVGHPTCTHAPGTTSCELADDGRVPDGWSTDCSTCE